MSNHKRFFLLGSILLMAALFLAFSPVAPRAHAASVDTAPLSSVSPDAFSCASRTLCLYQNEDGTGASISCATNVCRGAWYSTTVGGVHAGSAYDNSGSIFWTADVQADTEVCWNNPPGTAALDHSYGYYWVEYGIGSCSNAYTPPMP